MNLKLGIVGWPLTKTYSPLIHKLLGEFLGINVDYQKVPIENLDRQKIQDINSKFDGYNITVPHKNKIIELIENTDGYLRGFGFIRFIIFTFALAYYFSIDNYWRVEDYKD